MAVFRVQLSCDAFAFIDRTVEHYSQSDQVRELGDKLVDIERLIKNTPFEDLYSCWKLGLSRWDSTTQWTTKSGRQYPMQPVQCDRTCRSKLQRKLAEIIGRDDWIGDQIAVYVIMRWLQEHSKTAMMREEIASMVPPDCLDPLLKIFNKYNGTDRTTISRLASMLGPEFCLSDYDAIMIILSEFDRFKCVSQAVMFDASELDAKHRILSNLYPELDRFLIGSFC